MKWNIRIFTLLSLVLFVYYLFADRITPYTSNVRVKAIVIDVVPEVSGYVAEVMVTNGQIVEAGDLLARIDQRPFILDVERLRAELQSATQSVGAGSSGIDVSIANLAKAQANLDNSKIQGERIFQLERSPIYPGPTFPGRTLAARSGNSAMRARTTPRSDLRPPNWAKPNLPCSGPSCARRGAASLSI